MSDLISREAVLAQMKNYHDDCAQTSEYTRLGFETAMEVVEQMPSADIMECARAIKEYCKSKPDNVFLACFKCPFFDGLEKNEETVCKLFGKPPHEWDLPEGEKE